MKNSKKTLMVISFGVLLLIVLFMWYWNAQLQKQPVTLDLTFLESQPIEARNTFHYLLSKQASPELGIYTNFEETLNGSDLSTGHEVLSESIGLTMAYALLSNSPTLFESQYTLLKERFITQNGLVRWRIHASKKRTSETSALVDDFRIYKMLQLAYEKWDVPQYKTVADDLLDAVTIYETDSLNHALLPYYDDQTKLMAGNVPIFYLDLKAMAIAADNDSRWNDYYNESITILENAAISQTFPLYQKQYDYTSHTYTSDSSINIIEGLLPALYLSEINRDTSTVEQWMERELNNGGLKTSYNMQGKPTASLESTAGYAIGAQIAFNSNNKVLYEALLKRMNAFQINDESSNLFGAYGDTSTSQSFSFDNLQALIALAK